MIARHVDRLHRLGRRHTRARKRPDRARRPARSDRRQGVHRVRLHRRSPTIGHGPWWACALMFVREFLVTALRSAYEQRDLSLKTSYIAKAKTWTQMQGIGVMLLFPLVERSNVLIDACSRPARSFRSSLMVGYWVIRKKFWQGALRDERLVRVRARRVHLLRRSTQAPRAIMICVVAHHLDQRHRLHRRRLEAAARPRRLHARRRRASARLARRCRSCCSRCSSTPSAAVADLHDPGVRARSRRPRQSALAPQGRDAGARRGAAACSASALLLAGALALRHHATPLVIVAAAISVVGVTAEFVRGRRVLHRSPDRRVDADRPAG